MAKGVLIAAGYGTRFLPVTRTIPKEMLPIVDRPALDLVVRELVDGGVDELLVVTSRR
jgi:UTP--glucose-1-phosphate uridylyltransferase